MIVLNLRTKQSTQFNQCSGALEHAVHSLDQHQSACRVKTTEDHICISRTNSEHIFKISSLELKADAETGMGKFVYAVCLFHDSKSGDCSESVEIFLK